MVINYFCRDLGGKKCTVTVDRRLNQIRVVYADSSIDFFDIEVECKSSP